MEYEKRNQIPTEEAPQEYQDTDIEQEVLDSELARNILPYLTLEKLDQEEICDILEFSELTIDMIRDNKLSHKNNYGNILWAERYVADLSNETETYENDIISPKLQQARKLFFASLLSATEGDDNSQTRNDIYKCFFGMSPDISSYCGGIGDYLELLIIAERTPKSPYTTEIYGDLIYEYSFTDYNGFKATMSKYTPIQQLRALPICNNMALRCDPYNYSRGTLNKIIEMLRSLETDDGTKPLIKMVAESIDENIHNWHNADYIDIDEDDPKYMKMLENDRKRRELWRQKQIKLHHEFPTLPQDRPLAIIAPGVVGTVFGNGINLVANKEGQTASLLDYSKDNPFGFDRDTAFLISAAHSHGIKDIINSKTGVELETISLNAQVQFLKFMTEASNERFDKMCAVMRNIKDEKLRKRFLESFVAADFGEDFGDSLLTIAGSERLSDGEKEEVFDLVEFCRESIDGITGLFEKFDGGQFTNEYVRAANERLTDALKAFEMIAKNGVAAGDLDWAGKVKFDFRSAIEALQYEADSLEIINRTVHDVMSGREGAYAEIVLPPEPSIQAKWRTIYHFYSSEHGHVLLYTRPEGSHTFDPAIEYGKKSSPYNPNSVNTGVEASISFTANPVNPFDFPSPYRPNQARVHDLEYYDSITMDKVSAIRLDREGRAPGEPANDKNRDVIREIGMVSVDLAAIGDRYDTPSGKIARLISLGNLLRSKDHGTGFSLNHNTNWFNQDEYGTSKGFRKIVEYIDEIMVGLCFNHPPRKGDLNSFKGRFEKEKKKDRGRKTLGFSA
ncbi:hypothetical protein IKG49_03000 [Candidatus Saccharibacteria bacterium]|nr:hypothetical protein [Candidatus Saccharibacteria bacterium]